LPGAASVLRAEQPKMTWDDAQFHWSVLCLGLWLEQHGDCLRNT
jgi:hypothetical protein